MDITTVTDHNGIFLAQISGSPAGQTEENSLPSAKKTNLDFFPAPAVLDNYIMGGGQNYVRLVWPVECV